MTMPNAQSRGAEADPVPAHVNDASHQTDQPSGAGNRESRMDKSVWLNYILIGAGVTTTLGVITLLWGSAQNGPIIMQLGACLISAGSLGWLGAFILLTWLLIRDIGPLVWRGLRSVRQFFPKFNSKSKEQ